MDRPRAKFTTPAAFSSSSNAASNRAPHLFLPPYDSIHPDERARVPTWRVAQALQDGGPETLAVDARVLTGSGDWRWLRIRGTVVRNRDGKTYRIAGSMIDISRRKEAEAQVEDERFLLRQLIDHIPVQVYFKDLASRFVMANKGMAEWIGLHRQDRPHRQARPRFLR